ncbi:MAG: hypothetical protein JRH20_30945, partial [Deltaproteobacteria bacterium]|nr:hypothetical protein [Deltaproteobacteria bacterium]
VDGLSSSIRTTATLKNITIADHGCAGELGGGLLVENATVTLTNSILWNNGGREIQLAEGAKITVDHSDVQKSQSGEGNLSVDPRFGGGYHLASSVGRWDGATWVQDGESSPCIDTGDPQAPVGQESAPNGDRVNMGAFGGTARASKSP